MTMYKHHILANRMTEYLRFDHDNTKISDSQYKLFKEIELACCDQCFAYLYRQTELLFRKGEISLIERYLLRSVLDHDFREEIDWRVQNLRSLHVEESECSELEKKLNDFRRKATCTLPMTDAELSRPRHEI
jgi:hypothetical protein